MGDWEWDCLGGWDGSCCITTGAGNNPSTASNWQQLLCNYLPLRCRCRQQLPFRMGTAVSESECGSKPCVLPQLSPVAGRPAHRPHLRLRRQLLLCLWLQLWPSHLTRPRAWLVAAHALIIAGQLRSTWSHDRMAKWPNGTAIEQADIGAVARRLVAHQGQ